MSLVSAITGTKKTAKTPAKAAPAAKTTGLPAAARPSKTAAKTAAKTDYPEPSADMLGDRKVFAKQRWVPQYGISEATAAEVEPGRPVTNKDGLAVWAGGKLFLGVEGLPIVALTACEVATIAALLSLEPSMLIDAADEMIPVDAEGARTLAGERNEGGTAVRLADWWNLVRPALK
jgi:hypothetical protein